MMNKTCIKCGIDKPFTVEFFHPDKTTKSGLRGRCRDCVNARKREWRSEREPETRNTEEQLARRRELRRQKPSEIIQYEGRKQNLKARYGISVEEYDRLYEEQGGLCAICERPDSTGRLLAVDHCHRSGMNRSLLCGKCNRGIGMFNDDPDLMRHAAEYLESYHAVA